MWSSCSVHSHHWEEKNLRWYAKRSSLKRCWCTVLLVFHSFMFYFSSLKYPTVGGSCSSAHLKIKLNSPQQLLLFFTSNWMSVSFHPMCCWVLIPLYCSLHRAQCGGYDGVDSSFLLKPAISEPQMNVTTAQMERSRLTDIFPAFRFSNCKVSSERISIHESSQTNALFESEKPPDASLWGCINRSLDMKLNRLHPRVFLIPYALVCVWRFWLEFSV